MHLAKGLKAGHIRTLAKAITLIESKHPTHMKEARELLQHCADTADPNRRTLRIGITGAPGAGKSTFLDSFGDLIGKCAIFCVDPSSVTTGGSILGDKTRMVKLLEKPDVYIRPSPSGATLGGITNTAEDTVTLMEAAGFDYILLETVGVGQSESAVRNVCDVVVLLVPPASGDGLQGMKRGLMDVVDFVVVTKFDGETKALASRCHSEFSGALRLLGRTCHKVSAIEGTNMAELWGDVRSTQVSPTKRASQRMEHFRRVLHQEMVSAMSLSQRVAVNLPDVEKRILMGTLPPRCAAYDFVKNLPI